MTETNQHLGTTLDSLLEELEELEDTENEAIERVDQWIQSKK